MNPEQDKQTDENETEDNKNASAETRDLEPEKDPAGGRIKGAPQTKVNNTGSI